MSTKRKDKPDKPMFPCGMCQLECNTSCILCETCNSWYHQNCVSASQPTWDQWKLLNDISFVCSACYQNSDKEFDFFKSASRLNQVKQF